MHREPCHGRVGNVRHSEAYRRGPKHTQGEVLLMLQRTLQRLTLKRHANESPRCEVRDTLKGGYCEKPGAQRDREHQDRLQGRGEGRIGGEVAGRGRITPGPTGVKGTLKLAAGTARDGGIEAKLL